MRLGFIGTGSMGSMLIRAFAKEGHSDLQFVACNRTPDKVKLLSSDLPQLTVCDTAEEVVASSDHLFLCVRPADAVVLLPQLGSLLREDQTLYSLISAIPLTEVKTVVKSTVIKIIPSITQVARAGVCLVMLSDHTSETNKYEALSLLSRISRPVVIPEEDVRACADLASCGPAFMAHVLQQFVEAGITEGHLHPSTAKTLVEEMICGVAKLVSEEGFTFQDIIQRVSVPGGVTAEGIRVLEPRMEGVFKEVLRATRMKQKSHAPDATTDHSSASNPKPDPKNQT